MSNSQERPICQMVPCQSPSESAAVYRKFRIEICPSAQNMYRATITDPSGSRVAVTTSHNPLQTLELAVNKIDDALEEESQY